MADRCDYYFRQKVREAELDLGFELLEKADRDLAADIGLLGIVSGAVPAPHTPVADLTVDLNGPARAYDRLGQRIFFGTDQTVNCSVDHTGIPTRSATASPRGAVRPELAAEPAEASRVGRFDDENVRSRRLSDREPADGPVPLPGQAPSC